MRSAARRRVRLRTNAGRLLVLSRRWVCSCIRATRWGGAARTRLAPARRIARAGAARRARARPRRPSPHPGPCSASRRGPHRRRARLRAPSSRRDDLLNRREVRLVGPVEQARHRVGEVRERRAPVSGRRAVRVARVQVRVAVHRLPAERNREKGPAAAQPDRPRFAVGEALRDESPGRLPDVAGGRTAEGERYGSSSELHRPRRQGRSRRSSRPRASPAARRRSRARSRTFRARCPRRPLTPVAARAVPSAPSRRSRRRLPRTARRRSQPEDDHGGRGSAGA